jgi:hypothetical protein
MHKRKPGPKGVNIVRKVEGGRSNVSNLRLTHHYCHRKIHAQMEVVEPAAESSL